MQRNVNQQTDQYFQAPRSIRDAQGNVYDASNGTFELVQNWDSLSGVTNFTGKLDCDISCSAQLQYRKLYVGVAIDDWDSYELNARVELLLNNGVVATLPLRKSYIPPIQNGSGVFGQPCLIPATALDRTLITGNEQFDVEVPHEPCPFIQNELITTFTYIRPDGNDYEYWMRVTPYHLHCMFDKVQIIVDRWFGFPQVVDGQNCDGVATFILACASQRYS